jgi:hypothetical protein
MTDAALRHRSLPSFAEASELKRTVIAMSNDDSGKIYMRRASAAGRWVE